MEPATQALCFFYRNPPAESGVKPQPYKAIPKLIKKPHIQIGAVKMMMLKSHREALQGRVKEVSRWKVKHHDL